MHTPFVQQYHLNSLLLQRALEYLRYALRLLCLKRSWKSYIYRNNYHDSATRQRPLESHCLLAQWYEDKPNRHAAVFLNKTCFYFEETILIPFNTTFDQKLELNLTGIILHAVTTVFLQKTYEYNVERFRRKSIKSEINRCSSMFIDLINENLCVTID